MATILAFHAHPDDEVLFTGGTLARLAALLRVLRLVPAIDRGDTLTSFSTETAITHRVDVRPFAAQKQAALAAHRSQVSRRNRSGQLFRLLIALPAPVFGLLGGREWFAERGAAATTVSRDILAPVGRGAGAT